MWPLCMRIAWCRALFPEYSLTCMHVFVRRTNYKPRRKTRVRQKFIRCRWLLNSLHQLAILAGSATNQTRSDCWSQPLADCWSPVSHSSGRVVQPGPDLRLWEPLGRIYVSVMWAAKRIFFRKGRETGRGGGVEGGGVAKLHLVGAPAQSALPYIRTLLLQQRAKTASFDTLGASR